MIYEGSKIGVYTITDNTSESLMWYYRLVCDMLRVSLIFCLILRRKWLLYLRFVSRMYSINIQSCNSVRNSYLIVSKSLSFSKPHFVFMDEDGRPYLSTQTLVDLLLKSPSTLTSFAVANSSVHTWHPTACHFYFSRHQNSALLHVAFP